ncbi:MAG: shikimate kinase [Waddliaceae bacterium]
MNIVLIGFMGCGKSAAAQYLSHLLGLPYIETDELVYQKTNTRNMHEVFALGGELLLRETEIAIAKKYASKENLIVSAGGGLVLNKITLDYFKNAGGKVFFLNAGFDTIVKQLAGDDSRPLFKDMASAKKLYDFRLPLYLNYADEVIDVDSLSPDEIAWKIKKMVSDGL